MKAPALTLDLFGGDLSPAPSPAPSAPVVAAPVPAALPQHLIEISVQGIEHKSPEQIAHLATLALAVANEACPATKRGHSPDDQRRGLSGRPICPAWAPINPALLAFVAQARHHGHADPALTPISVDSAGRRLFDEVEVVRFANELLRGVRSDRPAMTPERWAEAIAKAREASHAR